MKYYQDGLQTKKYLEPHEVRRYERRTMTYIVAVMSAGILAWAWASSH